MRGPVTSSLALWLGVILLVVSGVWLVFGSSPDMPPPRDTVSQDVGPAPAPFATPATGPAPKSQTAAPDTSGRKLRYEREIQPKPPAPAPAEPKTKTYGLVVVTSGDTLKSGNATIHLAGVNAPAPDKQCKPGSGGETWPCGARARTAVRRLIQAKSVTCETVNDLGDGAIAATCKVGDTDLNEWVLQQGWARPATAAPKRYADAEAAAKKAGLGLWRNQ